MVFCYWDFHYKIATTNIHQKEKKKNPQKLSTTDILFLIVVLFNVNSIPSFFNICGIFPEIVLIILYFGFFYFRNYRMTSHLEVFLCLNLLMNPWFCLTVFSFFESLCNGACRSNKVLTWLKETSKAMLAEITF